MFQPVPYHHVSVASGRRVVNVAGQLAHALRSTARGLAGAGASFADVTRLRFFVARWEPSQYDAFIAGLESVIDELGIPQPLPPLSVIGVDYLF